MDSPTDRRPLAAVHRSTLDEIGAEPLAGSGFESETPDPAFTESAPPTDEADGRAPGSPSPHD